MSEKVKEINTEEVWTEEQKKIFINTLKNDSEFLSKVSRLIIKRAKIIGEISNF